ncbi:hypothetical protein OROMI_032704 [Orobanche minor]
MVGFNVSKRQFSKLAREAVNSIDLKLGCGGKRLGFNFTHTHRNYCDKPKVPSFGSTESGTAKKIVESGLNTGNKQPLKSAREAVNNTDLKLGYGGKLLLGCFTGGFIELHERYVNPSWNFLDDGDVDCSNSVCFTLCWPGLLKDHQMFLDNSHVLCSIFLELLLRHQYIIFQ